MEITRRNFMLGAGAILSTPAFAAGNDVGGNSKSGGVKRFEFGEDGTFTFLMIADWHRRTRKSNTAREIAVFRKAVARFKPALVVFGGDNVSGGTGLRVFRIRTFGSFESWTETEITLRSVL